MTRLPFAVAITLLAACAAPNRVKELGGDIFVNGEPYHPARPER